MKKKTAIEPFWEASYQNDDLSTFGIKPNVTVDEFCNSFCKDWPILDVGCGEGKNDIFLAEKGFTDIDAFDLSEAGIGKLKRLAALKDLKVNAWVQDLTQFEFRRSYGVVMTHGTLHFVAKAEWKRFLEDAKAHTLVGGYHIIQIFTNKLPATPDIAPFVKGLADEGELASLYADWELIQDRSYVFEDEHPDVPKHYHASNKIVARKR
jgi:cyclopropane fatty-acyl-phospholipid synthase-like methyltransferase